MDDALLYLLSYTLPTFSQGRSFHPQVDGSESRYVGDTYSSVFSPAAGLYTRCRRSTELDVLYLPRYFVSSPDEYVVGTREENEYPTITASVVAEIYALAPDVLALHDVNVRSAKERVDVESTLPALM